MIHHQTRQLFINEKECGGELLLYLHIPFCVKKCNYCDFLSFPAGAEEKSAYMNSLIAEVIGRKKEAEGYRVTGIFIGGGTPSYLDSKEILRLLTAVRKHYPVAEKAEITIEVNPGTVTKEKLTDYRKAGINRLSMGLQTAEEKALRMLGRIHTFEDFQESYQLAREAGFSNINVDLMSGLPEQSFEEYAHTLELVTALCPPPEHISAYSLIIEEGTLFFDKYEADELRLPDEEEDRRQYQYTKEYLAERGYERYEISNYAKKGYACKHNLGYWQRKNYLGFGIGAASLMENKRFRNADDLHAYVTAPLMQRMEEQELSATEQMEETLFLGLRMCDGVSEQDFYRIFNMRLQEIYGEVIQKNVADGLLMTKEGRIYLTEKGLDVSNYVMAQFLRDTD